MARELDRVFLSKCDTRCYRCGSWVCGEAVTNGIVVFCNRECAESKAPAWQEQSLCRECGEPMHFDAWGYQWECLEHGKAR